MTSICVKIYCIQISLGINYVTYIIKRINKVQKECLAPENRVTSPCDSPSVRHNLCLSIVFYFKTDITKIKKTYLRLSLIFPKFIIYHI